MQKKARISLETKYGSDRHPDLGGDSAEKVENRMS